MKPMTAEQIIKTYEEAKTLRAPYESDWRLAALYALPAHYGRWAAPAPSTNGTGLSQTRRMNFDTTGARSLSKYVSVLERLATPSGQKWHDLTASDVSLRRKKRVRAYFDQLTQLMFKHRYNPAARFRTTSNEMYASMGVYGNGPVFIGERKSTPLNRGPGLKYVACSMTDVFVLVDDEGEIVAVFRRFHLNVRQFRKKFPDVAMPKGMQAEASKPSPSETNYFEFVHYVCPRDKDSYDPEALDARRHPVVGRYIAVKDKEFVGDEFGYQSMPYKMPRTATVSDSAYGYSPAVTALAAMGGASSMKKTNIKQGNKAVDPVLLAHDDAGINGEVDQRPGAVNYGGVDRNGKLLIQPLRTGDFRVGEVLLQDERNDIEDSFFVTLFQILNDTPEMTATEVMERVAEKAALLSPTMGRLQTEFLGPTIGREIDVLSELGLLPPMPPELQEAQGEYEIVYTSPMAKNMYAEEVSGFMRAVEMALNTANATQDVSHLDHFNFETAIPEIADYMATPARWMHDQSAIDRKREDRRKQQEQAQLLQNAPALASAAKTANDAGML